MIFYFSATGNCKYIAERISEGDRLIAIADCMKAGKTVFNLAENENVGFVSPTYFWGLPSIVKDFLESLALRKNGRHYTYFIASYGTTTGQIAGMADQILKEKGFPLDGRFSIKMPDTWTVQFDLSNQEKVAAQNAAAEIEIEEVSAQIRHKVNGDFIKCELPYFMARCIYTIYQSARKTKHLSVGNSCIGCGLCARRCPVQAIVIENGRPLWKKEQCAMCLGCLHRWPKFAIQYGSSTRKHGQYQNPNTAV